MQAIAETTSGSRRPRRIVLLTGANRGIGRAVTELFLARGDEVIALVRDERSLDDLGPGRALHVVEARLDDAASVRAAAELVLERFPSLDGVVHNAAVQHAGPGCSSPPERSAEQFQVNVLAPLELTHRLAPHVKKGSGFVAFVSSGLAYVPEARSPVYGATKAALSHYAKAARLGTTDVRLIEVVLPLVDTDMTRGRGRRKLSAAEAARQIVAGLDRGVPTIRVGVARFLPILLWLAPGLLKFLMNRASRADPALRARG